jgi:transposase
MKRIINLKYVILKMSEGKTNKEIAKIYRVSPVTVARWVRKIKDMGREVPIRKRGARKQIIFDDSE